MVARRNTCLEIRKEPDVLSNLVRWDQHIEMDNLLVKKVLAWKIAGTAAKRRFRMN